MVLNGKQDARCHVGHLAGLAVAIVSFLALPCVGALSPQYTVTDLGTLGGTWSIAVAINDNGVVTGTSALSGNTVADAFIYANGAMTDLGALAGTGSEAVAINNSGVVIGTSGDGIGGHSHAFEYGQNGHDVIGDLGYFGDDPETDFNSAAIGISDNGTIVATSSYIAYLDYGSYGGVKFGGPNEGPYGYTPLTFVPAAISRNGTILSSTWGNGATPIAINDSGLVVGSSSGVAFLYTPGVGIETLGTLGGDGSAANAINDAGEVVGQSGLADGDTDAFLYSSDFGMIELNSVIPAASGWVLQSANAINADGQIAGDGVINGEERAFLLTVAVPEPAFAPCLMPACVGALSRRHRMAAQYSRVRSQCEVPARLSIDAN